jgi:integrase
MHLTEAATLFFRHLSAHNRSRYPKEVERQLRAQLLPHLGARPLSEIKKRDVIEVLDHASLRGPSNAHHLFAYTRTFFNWACARDLIEHAPTDRISRRLLLGAPAFRTRVLSDSELTAIWSASLQMGRFGTLVRLLILTGARKSEITHLRWSELASLDDPQMTLMTVQANRHKSRMQSRLPLSQASVEELRSLERHPGCEWVFPSRRTTSPGPYAELTKPKLRLDRLSGVHGWVLHDLRRSFRSGLSALGIAENVAELCLGHGKKGLARVYDLHRHEAEMRDAFEQWAGKVASLGKRA